MFFSIVVPVYNVEQYISRCIESVISQDYGNWELILIDDGSTDGSGSICDSYSQKDERIKVFHIENKGVSNARNTGIEHVCGDAVLFIDSDDWIDQGLLSEYKRCFEKDVDLVSCDMMIVTSDENGETVKKGNRSSDHKDSVVTGTDIYRSVLKKSATVANKAIKRDIIGDERFDTSMTFGEDTDFLVRILGNVRSLYITDFGGYYYLIRRAGNVVSSKPGARDLEFLQNNKRIYDRLSRTCDRTIGVHRINVAMNQVLDKLCEAGDDIESYRPYLKECRDLANYPSKGNAFRYLTDPGYTVKNRLRFLTCMISPVIWLKKKMRNKE